MKKSVLLICLLFTACNPKETKLNGYVEGEYLYIAPTTAGILQTLFVERGQKIEKDAPLFAIDPTSLQSALASAEAEIAAAKATYTAAAANEHRASKLAPAGATSRSDYDTKKALAESAAANIRMAEQKVVQIQEQLKEAAPVAASAARVEDTYYHAGEYVKAGTPVVSLLPPENVKLRFFVPQAELPHYKTGTELRVHCDGCAGPIKAKVSFIATQGEYTPPVIYSIGSRDKLVFMVEAKPEAFDPALHPGLPVDIERMKP